MSKKAENMLEAINLSFISREQMASLMEAYHQERSKWKLISEEEPVGREEGHWDGKRTDWMIVESSQGYHAARAYTGFLDGSPFCEIYDSNDFEIKGVIRWKYI